MKGFVLAAGFGTRLQPLTNHIPKALVPLAGVPLLKHALDFITDAGISSIGVNAHYHAEQITEFLKKQDLDCSLFIEKPDICGTGGFLNVAREFLSEDDTFIVVNADIITRFDVKKHISLFKDSNDCCRLVAWNSINNGTVFFNSENGAFLGTHAVTNETDTISGADFIGIALYRREFLSLVTGDDFSILPIWDRAQKYGMPISVIVESVGFWRDCGTPSALADIHFDILNGAIPLKPASYCRIDDKRKCCFPIEWASEQSTEYFGPYCWIEDPTLKLQNDVSRVIVFRGADMTEKTIRNGVFYTPWEEIQFE